MRLNTKYITSLFILSIALSAILNIDLYAKYETEVIVFGNRIESYSPKVALVLSGGGARGISQVGVIGQLENAKIDFDYIVGTSIGSVIGGLVSAGYTAKDLDSIVKTANWESMFISTKNDNRSELFLDQKKISDRKIISLRFDNFKLIVPESISSAIQFERYLQSLFWNAPYQSTDNYDDYKYKFRAVATDIIEGKSHALKSGSITKAIRASSTVPLRFTPVYYDDMLLIDGGILANIPVRKAIEEFAPDVVIAVNTTSELFTREELKTPWNVADQIVSISIRDYNAKDLAEADFVITPDLQKTSNTDFDNINNLVDLGSVSSFNMIDSITTHIDEFRVTSIKSQILETVPANFFPLSSDKINVRINSLSISHKHTTLNYDLDSFVELLNSFIVEKRFNLCTISKENPNSEITLIDLYTFPILNSINISSDYEIEFKELSKKILENYQYSYYSDEIESEIKEEILHFLRQLRFSFAKIQSLEFNPTYGELNIKIDIGKINSIKIKGGEIREFVVMRETLFELNKPLTADQIVASTENLLNTNLFRDVNIIPLPNENSGIDLTIELNEGGNQLFQIGSKLDNERELRVGMDFIHQNLFNLGTRLSMTIQMGRFDNNISLQLENQRIFNTLFTNRIQGYYDKRQFYEYFPLPELERNEFGSSRELNFATERYGVIATFGVQLERNGVFATDIRFENQRTYREEISPKLGYDLLNTIKFKVVFDTENRFDFPTEGQLFDLSLETGLFNFTNSVSFAKAEFHYNLNYSLQNHSIKPELHFGMADATLPTSEFFAFKPTLWFAGLQEDEIRGRQMFMSAMNYRYKLPFQIIFDTYVFTRYNFGNIWDLTDEIKFADLKHGSAIGVAFDTPVGPAQFSFSRAFYFLKNPNTMVLGPVVFYFSVGTRL